MHRWRLWNAKSANNRLHNIAALTEIQKSIFRNRLITGKNRISDIDHLYVTDKNRSSEIDYHTDKKRISDIDYHTDKKRISDIDVTDKNRFSKIDYLTNKIHSHRRDDDFTL